MQCLWQTSFLIGIPRSFSSARIVFPKNRTRTTEYQHDKIRSWVFISHLLTQRQKQ